MNRNLIAALFACCLAGAFASSSHSQAISAKRVTPNLESNVDRPMRYRPEGSDFVIENGGEFFNRPLYGGNTAFRVDAGDKPEFTMYLPGRGGNLRLGIATGDNWQTAKWLSDAQRVEARYHPGGMVYDIRDPLLGSDGSLHVEVYALAATEGLIVKAQAEATASGVELLWAYGGVNGQRGSRDGDIGTERVPISQYFQLSPDFCKGNTFALAEGSFTLKSNAAIIFARVPGMVQIADARQWATPAGLLGSVQPTPAELPVAVGHVPLVPSAPQYLSLQKLSSSAARELPTYREVTAGAAADAPTSTALLPAFAAADLPAVFDDAEKHFKQLRERVKVDTPDPTIDAAVGALNVAADALWDEPQGVIMHGAIAWRTRLLGWRGPCSLDDLGWHDRALRNISYWATRQNTKPIPDSIPPADESQNLSRNEAGLHTNGDMSNSHYDMNLVHIDAVFRHLLWTGDLDLAKKEWPIIQRHLAWERRLFRREYGPEKLPLYEAYAAIWASDDLEYDGGGTAHASAYNFYENVMAARLAKLIGADPSPYEKEAALILSAMQQYLWIADEGCFAEFRDYLGLQLPHPEAALWSVYHTIDSEVPTPTQSWEMTRYVDAMPHIPVRGKGVPTDGDFAILPTSTWMPYLWSINNVCMNENAHTALAYFQAGRADAGERLLKSSILASMYLGISPGNVGTMTYLDVYRRESQRDFGDGSGALSRAVVEGLFGVRPDALAGELRITPGFPAEWDHAAFSHPDVAYTWNRTGSADNFTVESHFAVPMSLRLTWPVHADDIATVTVNGSNVTWRADDQSVGTPRIVITAPANPKWEIAIQWKGNPIVPTPPAINANAGEGVTLTLPATLTTPSPAATVLDPEHVLSEVAMHAADAGFNARIVSTVGKHTVFDSVKQGAFTWLMPVDITVAAVAVAAPAPIDWSKPATPAGTFETVDLTKFFNQRVTQIFKQEYRSPRSPYVSLAIPKQGLGAWAGDANDTANIDDSGLRALSAKHEGKIILPNGVPLATPSAPDAPNIIFTSQWDNFPKEVTVPLAGKAHRVLLLMAGSTNPMQSRLDNGEVTVTYTDGTTARLALNNPINWWPIEQDYFIDDYQFRRPQAIPPRVNLKTGEVRLLAPETDKGRGGTVAGGAATVLDLSLDPARELKSLTVHTLANEVVVGLMSATLER